MKTNSFTPMGSMHPILFFVFIYAVTLLISVFICSSLFYSCNSSAAEKMSGEKSIKNQPNGRTEVVAFSQ